MTERGQNRVSKEAAPEAFGRVGKEKGATGVNRQPLHKGASGMSDQLSPEKAGFPPPPGCYLPLDS